MGTTLITGVSGFLGRHVAERARAAGHVVVELDRVGVAEPIDLLSIDQVRAVLERSRPDVVIHLAGALRSPDFKVLYETNVTGTAVLMEAMLSLQLTPRVVVVSSSAVYGNPTSDELLTEDAPLRPLTHYGASKAGQEAVALRAFFASNLPVMVARPFNLVGPGQPPSLAAGAFAEQIARAERSAERVMRVGDLSGSRDFVDVRDVADACLALASRGVAGRTYNLSSQTAVPLQRCVDTLLGLAQVPIDLQRDPARARANDAKAQVGSAARIKHDTGWEPAIAFTTSMRDLLDFWRGLVAQQAGAP